VTNKLDEKERIAVFELIKNSKNKNALSLRRLVRALNIRSAADSLEECSQIINLYA
jgi:hypothetical protein